MVQCYSGVYNLYQFAETEELKWILKHPVLNAKLHNEVFISGIIEICSIFRICWNVLFGGRI